MTKLKSIFDDVSKINGKLATVHYIKALKFKKDHMNLYGDLLKFTIAKNVKIGVNHDHATNNQQAREDHDPDYKAIQPPSGKVWKEYPILLTDKKTEKKWYIKFEQWHDLIIYDKWYEFKNKRIEKIDKFHDRLLASEYKYYASPQVTERKNIYLTIDLDNIIYIDVNGIRYIR